MQMDKIEKQKTLHGAVNSNNKKNSFLKKGRGNSHSGLINEKSGKNWQSILAESPSPLSYLRTGRYEILLECAIIAICQLMYEHYDTQT